MKIALFVIAGILAAVDIALIIETNKYQNAHPKRTKKVENEISKRMFIRIGITAAACLAAVAGALIK